MSGSRRALDRVARPAPARRRGLAPGPALRSADVGVLCGWPVWTGMTASRDACRPWTIGHASPDRSSSTIHTDAFESLRWLTYGTRCRPDAAAARSRRLRPEAARWRRHARAVLSLRLAERARRTAAAADLLLIEGAGRDALALIRGVRGADLAVGARAAALPVGRIDRTRRRTTGALVGLRVEVAGAATGGRCAGAAAGAVQRILAARRRLADARLVRIGRAGHAGVVGVRAIAAANATRHHAAEVSQPRRLLTCAGAVDVGQALLCGIGALAGTGARERILAARRRWLLLAGALDLAIGSRRRPAQLIGGGAITAAHTGLVGRAAAGRRSAVAAGAGGCRPALLARRAHAAARRLVAALLRGRFGRRDADLGRLETAFRPQTRLVRDQLACQRNRPSLALGEMADVVLPQRLAGHVGSIRRRLDVRLARRHTELDQFDDDAAALRELRLQVGDAYRPPR